MVFDFPPELTENVVANLINQKIALLHILFDIPHNIYPKPKDAP